MILEASGNLKQLWKSTF